MAKSEKVNLELRERLDIELEPLGGWEFTDPDTQFKFGPYKDKMSLVNHILAYRHDNKLKQLPLLENMVEDYQCRKPGMEGRYHVVRIKEKHARTIGEYYHGIKAAAKIIAREVTGDSALVSQSEADRRASICLNCPNRKTVQEKIRDDKFKTKTHKMTDSWMEQLVALKKKVTRHDAELTECKICGCPLKAKVHISKELILEETPPAMQKDLRGPFIGKDGTRISCWIVT